MLNCFVLVCPASKPHQELPPRSILLPVGLAQNLIWGSMASIECLEYIPTLLSGSLPWHVLWLYCFLPRIWCGMSGYKWARQASQKQAQAQQGSGIDVSFMPLFRWRWVNYHMLFAFLMSWGHQDFQAHCINWRNIKTGLNYSLLLMIFGVFRTTIAKRLWSYPQQASDPSCTIYWEIGNNGCINPL